MPWHIEKMDGEYCVMKDAGNHKMKCYSSKQDALDYMAALYANERSERMPDKPKTGNILEWVRSQLGALFHSADEQLRAVSMGAIYTQVQEDIYEYNPWAYIMDIFQDDAGALFAVVAQDGKLYRVDFTVDAANGDVTMGQWVEVMQEFVPTGRTLKIVRQADGKYRGFLISSTTVLNRVGEIDSTKLHNALNTRAVETNLYPFIDFFHLGDAWKIGQTDFLGLDENVAIASFLFDDTPLGRAMVKAYEADPEYWGASISYYPIGDPEILRINNVEIPVYNDGRYDSITLCPEKAAASLFTTLRAKEVTRMNKTLIEAMMKLAGEDEEVKKMVSAFIEQVDETNRTITERGLIRRNAEENSETPADAPVDTIANTDTEDGESEAGTVQVPADAVQEAGEVVLDEAAFTAITEHIFGSELWKNALAPLTTAIETLTATVQGLQAAQTEARTRTSEIDQRLSAVEATDEQKQKVWEADLSRRTKRTLNVTYRPSQPNPVADPQANGKPNFAEIAAGTLANLKK